ncbi:putative indoleacetamide hydrolase [Rhizobium freirei PRF 81]|uniref:Putative indoleacetamide hydrolase n=1 Tax=Rhizobium freirei PRF 81 TaxID=363754 RepID=N6V774_9HYPH|nr:amidase family protein [Rhizobium freirei]ENN89670.1 putative indoleacetamide hydrolase [Rhizobium freirei PRF 81]
MTAVFSPMSLRDARSIAAQHGPGALREIVMARAADNHDNAVIQTDATALPASDNGPLAGIAFGVKDNIDVAGYATTGACPGLAKNLATDDAAVVAALRSAGGYVPIKLNLHELAFGITSNNAAYGPVRNPFDPERCAGGSSGGSAAAIARGVVPFALGSDTGGSSRIPAAFCSVAGLRPSTGRYPAGGVLILSPTRDTIGPLAANCIDLAEIDAIISGEHTLPELPERPLRFGVLWDKRGLSQSVDEAIAGALGKLARSGEVSLVPISSEEFEDVDTRIGGPIVFNEAFQFWTSFCAEKLGKTLAEFTATIGSPDVRTIFERLPALAAKTSEAFLYARESGLASLRDTYEQLFRDQRLDAIIMPTVPVQPPRIGEDARMQTDAGTVPTFPTVTSHAVLATLTGAPSISISAGLDRDGLPVALMIEGGRLADRALLAIACKVEALLAP